MGSVIDAAAQKSSAAEPSTMAAPRTSSRSASHRAKTAMKRAMQDLDGSEDEEPKPTKRARHSTGPTAQEEEPAPSPQSDTSQSARYTSNAEDDHDNSMETIMESMAEATNEQRPARKTKVAKVANATADGPPSWGKPLVWAKARGSLCEALPYFRSFKSSLHSSNVVCQGFLIDQEVDQRDVFGAQVIISSVGGGRVKNPGTGNMIRTKDAVDTASNTKAIRNAHRNKSLVAVIADVWKEKQVPEGAHMPVTIWRMRFEKADLAEPSWWAPQAGYAVQSDPPVPVDMSVKARVVTCLQCNTPSKEIFTSGWFCLNSECEHYFLYATGGSVDILRLAYNKAFLNERTPFVGEIPSVIPAKIDPAGLHGTEIALRRGYVCPDCGCCNRRVYWNHWECENPECEYRLDALMRPYPEGLLEKETKTFDSKMGKRRNSNGVNDNKFNREDFLNDTIATVYNRECIPLSQTLTLGRIFSAKPKVLTKPNGPDDLFRTLELTDIGLRRNPAAVVGHKLEGYTRHFQQNFGARYKFGVTVQSKGFDEAPDIILRALQRLIWAKQVSVKASNNFMRTLTAESVSEHAIVPTDGDFNELLALGYMEDDKINYHDDGEHELGPVVAALALGSPSLMRFRPKRNTGFNLPTRQDRGRPCFKEVLEVTMKHGDIMVMVGTEIQKVYEHTVDPDGARRFSLTARYMDPERMATQADRDDAAVKGAIPEHAKAFVYDGF
ncbi:hypothetical protein CHGG_06386 [Chaetomium globosum CBS 148.51]|uniref:Alpha-ketoglutarate-dependent dioxygenase AlkB-like domain-containing protein n=1 Tax=Chaetomium globosum (strain ATCC 6205 / CBS 148.51 / DSM 1962 / NBRC 6347 / NRRL 1970) TaxID=306901 RepID=Q2H4M9_CHAGB|nr:uncharacterized protein CHGG_06386 [Chaetomium globosum CBS 148.51]EAQ89767.1 hypothetical protein CHGG_06386 [Chaetomium globosum CBS 148.51]